MRKTVYAVFDVGKTNKKLLLFDEERNNGIPHILEERQEVFPEIMDEDGFACDDIDRLTAWVRTTWNDLRTDPRYTLKGVNFTAYGASFVHLDANGQPVLPLYNYLKPLPQAIADQFYASLIEEQDEFAAITCSPCMGLLNSGLQLYWLKYAQPEQYARIKTSLHLPQYLSYLISGEKFSDFTSVGCHTALWDFNRRTYHDWVFREGIDQKLAPLTKDSIASVVDGTLVGTGMHDSSSALVPYLLQSNEPFLLISTGTWCINLNPFNDQPLTPELLHRDCLSYLSSKGQKTMASRVFFGREHDYQVERIARQFDVAPSFYKSLVWEGADYPPVPFKPACMEGTGPFPDGRAEQWDWSQFATARDAYQYLMQGLMTILQASIELIGRGERTFYVDGGFARNPLFMQMLGQRFPGRQICTLEVPQATALGALMHLEQGEASKQTRLLFT